MYGKQGPDETEPAGAGACVRSQHSPIKPNQVVKYVNGVSYICVFSFLTWLACV